MAKAKRNTYKIFMNVAETSASSKEWEGDIDIA